MRRQFQSTSLLLLVRDCTQRADGIPFSRALSAVVRGSIRRMSIRRMRTVTALGIIVLLAGCSGSSSSPATSQTPEQVYLQAYNDNNMGQGPTPTSESDKQEVIRYGKQFCTTYKQTNNVDKAAAYLKDVMKLNDTLTRIVELAATSKESLCPVQ